MAESAPTVAEVPTPVGLGRITLTWPNASGPGPGVLVLGHGAGGQSWSRDVLAVRDAAVAAGWVVALADQPWRLAGRKVAERAPRLDLAWPPLVAQARAAAPDGVLVVGGRSAGARVACRTHETVGADAVVALSFPLHPPGKPEASRAGELAHACAGGLPVLVVQGERDPFGAPEEVRAAVPELADLVPVPGTHTLTSPVAVGESVARWLSRWVT